MSEDAVHDAYSDVPIPLVPGMGLNDGMPRARPRTASRLRERHPRPVRQLRNRPRPATARAGKPAARPTSAASTAARREKHDPSWGHLGRPRTARGPPRAPLRPRRAARLAYAGVTLQFSGYFEDLETTVRTGLPRVRKCVITFHLEDATFDIREPRGVNSGIVQGPILRRGRHPGPDGEPLDPSRVAPGTDARVYGRVYRILSCDAFTRRFLEREGVDVPADLPFPAVRDPPPPEGQFRSAPSVARANFAPDEEALLPAPAEEGRSEAFSVSTPIYAPGSATLQAMALKESKGRQFLELDGRVLRFFATGEGARPGGDDARMARTSRAYVLHYFLADDTVEVIEALPRNSGMGEFSKILRRQKLPKPEGGYGVGIRPASEDTMRRGRRAFYHWRELKIGGTVNSYGVLLTLRDCDEHTREWYAAELGMKEADLAPMPPPAGPAPVKRAPPPPHVSGIGSDADSLESCYRLVPKPPKTVDYDSWAMNQGQVMRFTATIVPKPGREVNEIDRERSFVASFHLEDSTLSVYEPPVPNSGLPGGPFLQRRATKKPGSNVYLRARDMRVGAVIEVSGRLMRLNAADEATFLMMERRPAEFPLSDAAAVAAKLRRSVEALGKPAADELRRRAAIEDVKLGGGGAMALDRGSFLEVMCGAPGLDDDAGADPQSLMTLWRSLDKHGFDPEATRTPADVEPRAKDEEYVKIEHLFRVLGVEF